MSIVVEKHIFITREEYFDWCKRWLAEYQVISTKLRQLKHAIAASHKDGINATEDQHAMLRFCRMSNAMLLVRFKSKVRAGVLRNYPMLTGDAYLEKYNAAFKQVELKRRERAAKAKAAAKVRLADRQAEQKIAVKHKLSKRRSTEAA